MPSCLNEFHFSNSPTHTEAFAAQKHDTTRKKKPDYLIMPATLTLLWKLFGIA
jgi:hypothetical protein